jgi:hypothetical protein
MSYNTFTGIFIMKKIILMNDIHIFSVYTSIQHQTYYKRICSLITGSSRNLCIVPDIVYYMMVLIILCGSAMKLAQNK